jgi:hypothetical protein
MFAILGVEKLLDPGCVGSVGSPDAQKLAEEFHALSCVARLSES